MSNDPRDSQLEAMLREHFGSELDGQLGRAAAHFERMARFQTDLAADAAPAREGPRPPHRMHVNGWMLGLVGGAVAAAISAVMIFSPAVRITPGGPSNAPALVQQGNPVTAETIPVAHEVAWNTVDRGTVFVGEDEQPMRSYVRQRVDNFRWVDPRTNVAVEMVVPQDEVMLVNMNSH